MVISRILTSGLALTLSLAVGYSLNDSSEQSQQLSRENSALKRQVSDYSNELERINHSITNNSIVTNNNPNSYTSNTVEEDTKVNSQVYTQASVAEDVPKTAGPIDIMIAEFNSELLRNEKASLINPFIR